MTMYLKGYQKYDRSKFKHLNSNKSRIFNPIRYRVIQYLFGKLLDMVKMGQEGLVMAALFVYFRTF